MSSEKESKAVYTGTHESYFALETKLGPKLGKVDLGWIVAKDPDAVIRQKPYPAWVPPQDLPPLPVDEGQPGETIEAYNRRNEAHRQASWEAYVVGRRPSEEPYAKALAHLQALVVTTAWTELQVGLDNTWFPSEKFRYVWRKLTEKHQGQTSSDLVTTSTARDKLVSEVRGEDGLLLDPKSAVVTFSTLQDRLTKQNQGRNVEVDAITQGKLSDLIVNILASTQEEMKALRFYFQAWQSDRIQQGFSTLTYADRVQAVIKAIDIDIPNSEKSSTSRASYAHKPPRVNNCYKCGKPGHVASNCVEKEKERERPDSTRSKYDKRATAKDDYDKVFEDVSALPTPEKQKLVNMITGGGSHGGKHNKKENQSGDKRDRYESRGRSRSTTKKAMLLQGVKGDDDDTDSSSDGSSGSERS